MWSYYCSSTDKSNREDNKKNRWTFRHLWERGKLLLWMHLYSWNNRWWSQLHLLRRVWQYKPESVQSTFVCRWMINSIANGWKFQINCVFLSRGSKWNWINSQYETNLNTTIVTSSNRSIFYNFFHVSILERIIILGIFIRGILNTNKLKKGNRFQNP